MVIQKKGPAKVRRGKAAEMEPMELLRFDASEEVLKSLLPDDEASQKASSSISCFVSVFGFNCLR